MSQFRQFVESLERLYSQKKIGEVVILMMYRSKKITEDEKKYILHENE